MAWVMLLISAAALLVVGLLATALLLGDPGRSFAFTTAAFWLQFAVASGLTALSLTLRSLRWIFLLRRSNVRIPIRDAYVGYFAGLSLLLTPLLLGEIAVRAVIHRTRGGVPIATTVVVNLWERLLDLTALALLSGLLGLFLHHGEWSLLLLLGAAATSVTRIRRVCLRIAVAASRPAARWFDDGHTPDVARLETGRAWAVGLASSVAAWFLPGIGFWLMVGVWGHPFGLLEAEHAYATSASLGGLVLAPGGVLVAGGYLLAALATSGLGSTAATLTVFAIRLATAGMATVLGCLFVLIHLKTPSAASTSHFDEIADAYDVQIPWARRDALLTRKTELMRASIDRLAVGPRGLDVGCGQGAYIARMRELGFDVSGIDPSEGQLRLASRRIGHEGLVTAGSVLSIPAATASYDFAYVINVLHHLPSVDDQRRAFDELIRVVKPGGLVFVHEINTRNMLFRFYMGYVFPSLNCIDEGVERWLRPDRLDLYTQAPVVDVSYFTFLPEFLPRMAVRLLTPIERFLEASPLRVYSGHYMAVLRNARPAAQS
jgi:ubiquinone/menaquinone biosynthesis C-methylase UbiE/uncharacterized membrane protein YbhN (UPF0104 family)